MKKQTNDSCFVDTNVLVYAFSSSVSHREAARELLAGGGVISIQVLNEFVAVARRKLKMNWQELQEALSLLGRLFPHPLPLTIETHNSALLIAKRYGYHIFDSLLISAALQAECKTLFTEDMREGQKISGLTIRNPFA